MIQVHKDSLGNITGYFDTEAKQWVPEPAPTEALAADADDTGEPAQPVVVDWEELTKIQLKNWLADNNIAYPHNADKAALVEIAKANWK